MLLTRLIVRFMSAPAASAASAAATERLLASAAGRMPPLTFAAHKGQAGRLCIVGGCREYTGAPYFAAAACLRVGADLAHIFCAEAAAPVIKAYSPELIVHPVLDAGEAARREMELWFPRFNAVLVGPGLGRAECVPGAIAAIELAVALNKPLVIDADGLALVTERPQLISGYRRVILTPNIMELGRLGRALCDDVGVQEAAASTAEAADVADLGRRVSAALGGGVALLCKGRSDVAVVADADAPAAVCDLAGSPRRCGGQGDVLSGLALAFANWCHHREGEGEGEAGRSPSGHPGLLAAFAAAALARRCAAEAFALNGRATLASDLLAQIGPCARRLFPGSGDVRDP